VLSENTHKVRIYITSESTRILLNRVVMSYESKFACFLFPIITFVKLTAHVSCHLFPLQPLAST